MDKYKRAVLKYVSDCTISWSPAKLVNVGNELREWMNARDKHFVIDFFDDSDNRLIYAQRLYGSRVNCFYEILKETYSNKVIVDIMKNKSSIVSFGCGPGPEVAAYICYVRDVLNLKHHYLNIVAIDCLQGWKPFVEAVADLGDYATVRFETGLLSNNYLSRMKHCDVCIMSYPHAMNFEDIWTNLKKKFTLIIFIDQAKGPILQMARRHGFQFVNFLFNGSKTFFYYIDENYDSDNDSEEDLVQYQYQQYPRQFKCKRQLHNITSSSAICMELIDLTLSCNHTKKIFCYQNDQNMKFDTCTEMVNKWCLRNKHESLAVCGSAEICKEKIKVRRKCGHIETRTCSDSSDIIRPCMVETVKLCKKELHRKLLPCSSVFVCDENIPRSLKCGHTGFVRCYDVDSMFDTKKECLERVEKTCSRGLHSKVMNCPSPLICVQPIKCRLACGHTSLMKCCEDISEIISTVKCKIIVSTKCKRNIHEFNQECYLENHCYVSCPLVLQCGCFKNVNCDNYDIISRTFVCRGECRSKSPAHSMLSQIRDVNTNATEHAEESCCYFRTGKPCKETCNKALGCGHKCLWTCFLCLNGRLHGRCLMKCSRTMSCGHLCSDNCHEGNCRNCSVKCFVNRVKRFFQIKWKMSAIKKSQWQELLLSMIENEPTELATLFEKIRSKIEHAKLSRKEKLNYKVSFKNMKALLDVYDSLDDEYFPAVFKRYIEDVHRSILAMLRWISPEEIDLTPSSFESFNIEFERIKIVITLCRISQSYIVSKDTKRNNKIYEILDKLMVTKFTAQVQVDTCQQITEIMNNYYS